MGIIRRHRRGFQAGILSALGAFVAINAVLGPTSNNAFCGAKCHEMNTAYNTWELSTHGANKYGLTVNCIDCHLPPKEKFFTHLAAKSYEGAKDGIKHVFGGEYDLEKTRKKVLEHIPSKRCIHCHDNLLKKPSGSAARKAHVASLADPDTAENRCVRCHENAGHEREKKLFSP
ncbi:MAG: cytochrome c3 family protein [Planctomycetota bacterium]|jgi:cytochrome c-type protein NapC/trimethylamine-N-oxide reductase cytochrome c-type subunit TorC